MKGFILIGILIGFSHLTIGQDKLLSPAELQDRLEQLSSIDTTLYHAMDPKWITKSTPPNELATNGIQQLLVSPGVLDQNRILLQKLDWKTSNMPIRDLREEILSKDP